MPRGIIKTEKRKEKRKTLSRYQLNTSDDLDIMCGLKMDKATKECMKQLDLPRMRSTGDRKIDRTNAIKRWKDKVNLKDFAIHHCFDGLIGLVPRDLHTKVHHKGYISRLSA